MFNDNGDMVTESGQVFRQVGFQIHGGEYDGLIIENKHQDKWDALMKELSNTPHGGFSPVYIEVGSD